MTIFNSYVNVCRRVKSINLQVLGPPADPMAMMSAVQAFAVHQGVRVRRGRRGLQEAAAKLPGGQGQWPR